MNELYEYIYIYIKANPGEQFLGKQTSANCDKS